LPITVKCDSLEILERLLEDYSSGHEEYIASKMYFEKDPVQGNSFKKSVFLQISKISKELLWLN